MGGLDLALEGWKECERCERHRSRLGVYAPKWPDRVRVVIMTLNATMDVQLMQRDGIVVERLVSMFAHRLDLAHDEIVGDVLVACGMGPRPGPDEIAACSARFAIQARLAARPSVVVFVGNATKAMAIAAGLLDDRGNFAPCGTTLVVQVLVVDPGDPEPGLRSAALALNILPGVPIARSQPSRTTDTAKRLLDVLGDHEGHGELKQGHAKWSRHRCRALTTELVDRHLKGELFVSAFRPTGAWRFVVLDVDRHNSIQANYLDETLLEVQRHFPNSLAITSSASGGAHVYVALPEGVRYQEAALWVKVYLTAVGLRWKVLGVVTSELVEVPSHPPRLPFGVGSMIRGSVKPLDVQIEQFVEFVLHGRFTDYERMIERLNAFKIERRVPFSMSWTPAHPLRIARWLAEKELGIDRKKKPKLGASDPWRRIVTSKMLPHHLAHVAANGVPSYGTRHRWTRELIKWLADVVDRETLQRLMPHWLQSRRHISRDIDADLEAVTIRTAELVDAHYQKLAGVPVRVWTIVEADVRAAHPREVALARMNYNVFHNRKARVKRPRELGVDLLLVTAFFILRGFFEAGSKTRPVPRREFMRFAKKNAADVEKILTRGHWLRLTSPAVQGVSPRCYLLVGETWPAMPGEERIYLPPLPIPPRRY